MYITYLLDVAGERTTGCRVTCDLYSADRPSCLVYVWSNMIVVHLQTASTDGLVQHAKSTDLCCTETSQNDLIPCSFVFIFIFIFIIYFFFFPLLSFFFGQGSFSFSFIFFRSFPFRLRLFKVGPACTSHFSVPFFS